MTTESTRLKICMLKQSSSHHINSLPKCRPLFVDTYTYGWMLLVVSLSILLTLVLIAFQGAKLAGGEEEDVKMWVVHKSLKHLLALGGVRVGGCQAREAVEVPQLQLLRLFFGSLVLKKATLVELQSFFAQYFILLHICTLLLLQFLRHSSYHL